MQEFLSKAGKVAKETAGVAADKTGELVETAKTKAKIHSAKSGISDLQKEIGKLYFDQYLSGEQLEPQVVEICEKIKVQLDLIDELEQNYK